MKWASLASGVMARSPLEVMDSALLDHPEVVAGRIAEAGVDAVRLLRRLLCELHSALLELLIRGAAVVRREEQAAGGALRHQRLDLVARLLVEHGRAGNRHQRDRDVLAGHADGEPAEVAELGNGDVLPELHAELLGVEGERLVLVVDPDLRRRQLVQHLFLLVEWTAPTLAGASVRVFSKRAGLRTRVGLQDAGRNARARR